MNDVKIEVKNHREQHDIYEKLLEAGTLDHPRNITFKIKLEHAIRTQDLALAQSVLDEYPYLYHDALRVIAETKRYEEHWVIGPPPTPEELPDLKGDIPIGEILPNGEQLGIFLDALNHNMVEYGSPGTGKTRLKIQMLRYIFEKLNGVFNAIIFDAKRDYIHFIREFPDLIVLKAKDLRYNILEEKEGWLDAVRSICDENFFGGHSKVILEDAYKNCLIKNGILKVENIDGIEKEIFTDRDNYPNFTEVLAEIMTLMKKQGLKGNAFLEIQSKLNIHLRQYEKTGAVFNCKKGFPLDFFRKNNIVIDITGESKEIMCNFTSSLLHRIYRYNRDNNIRSEIPTTLFVFDEAGWWLGSDRDNVEWATNETRDDILRKGREFGIAIDSSFQQSNLATKQLRQNTRYKFTFQIESDSLREAQIDFALTDEQRDYLAHKLPPKFIGIYKGPNFDRPILFKIPNAKPLAKDVTFDEIDIKMKPLLKKLNKSVIPPAPPKPPKTPEEIKADEERIKAEKYEKHIAKIRKSLYPHTRSMLKALCTDPYQTKTELKVNASGSDTQFEKSIETLLRFKLVETLIFSKTTKTGEYFPLTKKAHDVLGSSIEDRKRCPLPGRFKHHFFCEKCADHLKSMGYTPTREFTLKGMKDISFTLKTGDKSIMKCRIDVAAEIKSIWYAFEVIVTDAFYIETTLHKCIKRMKMDRVVIIMMTAKERDKITEAIKETKILTKAEKEKVQVMSTNQFFKTFKV